MLLLIDNYDSFVFNLARYFNEAGCETRVVRNDEITVESITDIAPAGIVISPGPCTPAEAGISVDVVRRYRGKIPILGVCLGHQSIGVAYGCRIIRAPEPIHGRTSIVHHNGSTLMKDIASPMTATRYHSLIIEETSIGDDLKVTARTTDKIVMAVENSAERVYGVQFHPESILTEGGHALTSAFARECGLTPSNQPSHELADGALQRQPSPDDEIDWDDQTVGGGTLHW